MEKVGDLVKEQIAAEPERDMRKRVLTVKILGPDSSEIATGWLKALRTLAAEAMERHKGIAVSVKLEEI